MPAFFQVTPNHLQISSLGVKSTIRTWTTMLCGRLGTPRTITNTAGGRCLCAPLLTDIVCRWRHIVIGRQSQDVFFQLTRAVTGPLLLSRLGSPFFYFFFFSFLGTSFLSPFLLSLFSFRSDLVFFWSNRAPQPAAWVPGRLWVLGRRLTDILESGWPDRWCILWRLGLLLTLRDWLRVYEIY